MAKQQLEEPTARSVAENANGKRAFLDLNGWQDPLMKAYLEKHGCALTTVTGFASRAQGTAMLQQVKAILRKGRAIWLNIRIGEAHRFNPKWVSQCCRMAHRAGIPRTLRFTLSNPWRIPEFNALRIYKYACLIRVSKAPKRPDVRLTSGGVDSTDLLMEGLCKQAVQ